MLKEGEFSVSEIEYVAHKLHLNSAVSYDALFIESIVSAFLSIYIHLQHFQCSQSNAVLETVSRAVPLRSYPFNSFQRPVWFASDRMIFYMVPIFAHTVQDGASKSRHVQKSSRHVKNIILDSFVNLI